MEQSEFLKWKKAGEISSQIMAKAIKLAKPETPLLEIAEKLEEETEKLKVKWAFPINLSINEIIAHNSPLYEDKTTATGLLKIDLGISVDGFISDIARTVDLTPEQKYKEMISTNESALKDAIKIAKYGIEIREIGRIIQNSITKAGFSPIRNLAGHEMKQYDLHAGLTIPNYDNGNTTKLKEGIYAIEPFATIGEGIVIDGKPSGVYILKEIKPVRNIQARKIMEFIKNEYKTLPFSARWIIKKFGFGSLLSLKILEQQGILHQFSQLIEKSRAPGSQVEDTILIEKNKVTVLTTAC
ncbi:MAG: type II methionyl aminopeptidase [Candidatus Pacearchaeota archaeon]